MRQVDRPTVLVIRHPATSFNRPDDPAQDRLKGTAIDLPLTDDGHAEAERIAKHVAEYPVGSIEHSKMLRTAQTAKHIEDATGVKSKEAAGLDPMDVGVMSGMRRDKAAEWLRYYIEHPEKQIPEGGKVGDWHEGWSDWLAGALTRAERDPKKIHIGVAHSCNAVNVDSALRDEPVKFHGSDAPPPGSMTKISKHGGHWRMSEEEMGTEHG